ncbi:hypothetical protein BWQ96_06744 [Gracilariopsis chorda]|uniref:Uncharacterized protein n=1 Tax=Gracilariopsis chorda TaxID=448386 RepID=A0A2V3IN52_9FLOR|nr:hypothetical protein BWQ96_06744 [Gracilariopsis chorda]|eukprot:PXF43516.1 hypothetical protein BWQ96_06744 [Gracilariopsis chorda]
MEGLERDDGSYTTKYSPSEELITGQNHFKPLNVFFQWQEPDTTHKRITAAILLPAGVEKRLFSVHIEDDGDGLELIVKGPKL